MIHKNCSKFTDSESQFTSFFEAKTWTQRNRMFEISLQQKHQCQPFWVKSDVCQKLQDKPPPFWLSFQHRHLDREPHKRWEVCSKFSFRQKEWNEIWVHLSRHRWIRQKERKAEEEKDSKWYKFIWSIKYQWKLALNLIVVTKEILSSRSP